MRVVVGLLAAVFSASTALAETVDVKYRGPVDLKPFVCIDTKSSFVNRVATAKRRHWRVRRQLKIPSLANRRRGVRKKFAAGPPDRCRPFARNIWKLKTKSPPRGAGQKSASIKTTNLRRSHAQIFFLALEIFVIQTKSKKSNPKSFQRHRRLGGIKSSHLFSATTGGGQKFAGFEPGTVGRDAHFSANYENLFFRSVPRGDAFFAAKFRVGG